MDKEKILTYTWKEFLKSPFSVMFFGILLAVGFITYSYKETLEEDKVLLEERYNSCVENRLKDKDLYLNILHEIEVSKTLKKDSVR